jgi:5-methylcytosine-specific restriction endonuclease McrBC regulatory subunit McrC
MPVVPGSASEVPPWVLAGPVLSRLADLLRDLKRGYEFVDDIRVQPKGTILWAGYARRHVPHGDFHHVPCRYPDLGIDPEVIRAVRWTLERLHSELARVGGRDRLATTLVQLALRLLEKVKHVRAERPRPETLHQTLATNPYLAKAIRRGLQAIGWIVEERGLGGTNTSDGLAWALPLEVLWEHYVEAHYRSEARMTGATIRVGRLNETTVPIRWSQPFQRSLSHLMPDVVLQRGRSIHVVDAKYKAHFVDLDERGWREFQDEERSAHRSDVHQVLAYAGLFDAEHVTATLVYPLRRETYLALAERRQDRSNATLYHGNRELTLELRGLPFGSL